MFQDETTQSIVTSIFDELGFKGSYSIKSMPSTSRAYCLQFAESDYQFVTRLLAEEGVHFYFGKDDKADMLYLQDASKSFEKTGLATVDDAASPSGDYDVLNKWQREHEFHSASLEIAGYDYRQSKLVTSKAKKSKYSMSGNTKLTAYRYPSASMTQSYTDLASALSTVQRGQLDSRYDHAYGESESADLCAGHYLKLSAHPQSSEEGNYLVASVHYEFGSDGSNQLTIFTSFMCVPEDQDFYPAMIEKPRDSWLAIGSGVGKYRKRASE